mmetsp:Transcript_22652/g.55894  ORF Transcript_22652/g.55894 Transcript_22652/m.55894 type:complete len:142 (+) Transcript_22652:1653-2078(+)
MVCMKNRATQQCTQAGSEAGRQTGTLTRHACSRPQPHARKTGTNIITVRWQSQRAPAVPPPLHSFVLTAGRANRQTDREGRKERGGQPAYKTACHPDRQADKRTPNKKHRQRCQPNEINSSRSVGRSLSLDHSLNQISPPR